MLLILSTGVHAGSTNPPVFVCASGETFPLEGLCNGNSQCSDSSDETNLLCEGMNQCLCMYNGCSELIPASVLLSACKC